jgi:hypothetical protein
MITNHLKSRIGRSAAGVLAAVLCTASVTAVTTTLADAAPVAEATGTPHANLQSGDVITVSVTGFPANAVVAGVQCDERVLTGDPAYCDATNVAVITTDATGAGTADFTVKAGADFVSANGMGVCDAQHACELALQSQGATPAVTALLGLSFGAKTKTAVTSAKKKYAAGKSARIKVAVTGGSVAQPTGKVVVKDNGKVVASMALPASGRVKVTRKLSKGTHKITARYAGDTAFAASSGSVTLVAKPKKK